MQRFFALAALAALTAYASADDAVDRALRVQVAMAAARNQLSAGRPAGAIKTLEAELARAEGQGRFLHLLRKAYADRLQELVLKNGDAAERDRLKRRLAAIEGGVGAATPVGHASPPSPPEPVQPIEPAAEPRKDPFQQKPLDDADHGRAFRLYESKEFSEAAQAFARLVESGESLSAQERNAWAYCRTANVFGRIRAGDIPADEKQTLLDELRQARGLVVELPKLTGYIDRVAARLAEPAAPARWQELKTNNFRVRYKGDVGAAERVGRLAEVARGRVAEMWTGSAGRDWQQPCDLVIHPDGAAFAKATGKPAGLLGLTRVRQRGRSVVARRIDLAGDAGGRLNDVLAREVAHLVVADAFADLGQPVPRWAERAMVVLAQSPSRVARYVRTLRSSRTGGGWLTLRRVFAVSQPPTDPAALTAFLVESVALTKYLIELKGPTRFGVLLREAERRGLEPALKREYGFASVEDLERRFLRHYALGG